MKDTKIQGSRPQPAEGGSIKNLRISPSNDPFYPSAADILLHGLGAPLPDTANSRPSWRRQLAEAIRDPDLLCEVLQLPESFREGARVAANLFPLVVTYAYANRMQKGNVDDPLLRQVLPVIDESFPAAGFTNDPVGEQSETKSAGILQKYRGRALMVLTSVCAVNCRYCFRRHFPYEESPRGLDAWQQAIESIREDESIDEVILSGGDPLTLTDEWLAKLVATLGEIKHLKRLRVHSRLPIVLPDRVTPSLIQWLTSTKLQPIMVVHANHPNELGEDCAAALKTLADAGVLMLNQSVLLRGVNDDAMTLSELSLKLIEHRVMPYYLHQLDRVSGAAHFEVSEEEGRKIIQQMSERLPGYAVPKYVREIAGEPSKTPIFG